jgi:hypothetical protein
MRGGVPLSREYLQSGPNLGEKRFLIFHLLLWGSFPRYVVFIEIYQNVKVKIFELLRKADELLRGILLSSQRERLSATQSQ